MMTRSSILTRLAVDPSGFVWLCLGQPAALGWQQHQGRGLPQEWTDLPRWGGSAICPRRRTVNDDGLWWSDPCKRNTLGLKEDNNNNIKTILESYVKSYQMQIFLVGSCYEGFADMNVTSEESRNFWLSVSGLLYLRMIFVTPADLGLWQHKLCWCYQWQQQVWDGALKWDAAGS